jgi:hypothetical protein
MRYGDDWLLQLLIAGCQWPVAIADDPSLFC